MSEYIELAAKAKINLTLDIIKKLPTGFHEIKTVYQEIDLADNIIIRPYEENEIRIFINNREIKLSENLAYLAAKQVLAAADCHKGVDIIINKRIPLSAGLGGGSSDAAAVINGLNKLFSLGLAESELRKIASSLGKDIPFFLQGKIALGTGLGDTIQKLPSIGKLVLLVIVPNFKISTARAYELAWGERIGRRVALTDQLVAMLKRGESTLAEIAGCFHNDFEEFLFRRYPKLNEVFGNLLRAGSAINHLSGSGSAVWAAFPTQAKAKQVIAKLKGKPYDIYLTKI